MPVYPIIEAGIAVSGEQRMRRKERARAALFFELVIQFTWRNNLNGKMPRRNKKGVRILFLLYLHHIYWTFSQFISSLDRVLKWAYMSIPFAILELSMFLERKVAVFCSRTLSDKKFYRPNLKYIYFSFCKSHWRINNKKIRKKCLYRKPKMEMVCVKNIF